jgi:hypothetical protein
MKMATQKPQVKRADQQSHHAGDAQQEPTANTAGPTPSSDGQDHLALSRLGTDRHRAA